LQANAIRYLAETGYKGLTFGLDWAGARQAVWYFTRLIIEIMPETIMWWDDRAAMDNNPHIWTADSGFVFPASDPTPSGAPSKSSRWPERD